MGEILAEQLLRAIKKDDIKTFQSYMEQSPCGTFRLGRFPVLSVIYLYNAKKLEKTYEEKFLKYNSWQPLEEPMPLANDFRKRAGKCLRYFLEETVSPYEMLLILDKTEKLKRLYPDSRLSPPIKQRLKGIYSTRYSLNLKCENNQIVMDRRPLTKGERKRLLLAVVSAVLCLVLIATSPFVINAISPFIAGKDGVVHVDHSCSLNLAAERVYRLENDITLPDRFFAGEVKCELDGNGKTVTVNNSGPILGAVSGKIHNVVFNLSSSLAQKVEITGILENVTVNVTADESTNQSMGFVVWENYGQVLNVTANLRGKLSATAVEDENYPLVGGIVGTNGATKVQSQQLLAVVDNCRANYNGFSLQGVLEANASFGGIVGKNDGYVQNCETSGDISAEVFDLAGVCCTNNYLLYNTNNGATLFQTSSLDQWNPLVSGIVLTNEYSVENCINNGNLKSLSTCGEYSEGDNIESLAVCTGVAYLNRSSNQIPRILKCANNGAVTAEATHKSVYASGVCISSNGRISGCVNTQKVSAKTSFEKCFVNVSGICCLAYGDVGECASTGDLFGKCNGEATVGGICGVSYVSVYQCATQGNILGEGKTVYVGGILAHSNGVVSGGNVYCGSVRASACLATVSAAGGGDNMFVGGVIGYLEENYISQQNIKADYYGGKVYNCYFLGSIDGGQGFGGIVGGCGQHILEADPSLEDNRWLEDNWFGNLTGAQWAVGAKVVKTDNSTSALEGSNWGATQGSVEEITQKPNYQLAVSQFPE